MPLLFLLTALFLIPWPAYGASIAVADINEGYGNQVLNKLYGVWAPPPNLKGDFKLRVKIAVDGGGKVRECAIVKSSGMEALDTSACGAVRQISKFDAPPYGVPCEVYVSFWTGTPKGNTKELPPDPMEALRAEMIEREKMERAMSKERADATEERARERAEQAARRAGKALPDAQPHPVDSPSTRPIAPPKPYNVSAQPQDKGRAQSKAVSPAPESPAKSATKQVEPRQPDRQSPEARPAELAERAAQSSPAVPASGLTEEELRLTMMPAAEAGGSVSPSESPKNQQIPPPAPPVAPSTPQPFPEAQGNADTGIRPVAQLKQPEVQAGEKARGRAADPVAVKTKEEKYLSSIHWTLLKAIIIPAETKPGVYFATVRLYIRADGSLDNCEITSGTGDGLLDKYVMRGIRKTGKLPPPPPAYSNPVELTFKLRRS
ncbi:MAG: TonB family protein [Desulfovibrio sp.]|jgi:TonB family protein|nr:TonB family protein [Desulfovibrio sp.]